MVTKEEFNKIGKKYGLVIYESIFGGYLTYVKDGIAVSVYNIEYKIVTVSTKYFMEKADDTKVVNNIEELENALKAALKNLKEYKIQQKMDIIEKDF